MVSLKKIVSIDFDRGLKKLCFFCFFLQSACVIGAPQLERCRTSVGTHRGQAECEEGAFSNRKRIHLGGSNSESNFDPSCLRVYDSKRSNLALRSTCAHTYMVEVLSNQFFFLFF